MADTPTSAPAPISETVKPEAPSPDVTPSAAPVANATDPAEVERLRKETEQKDLRIRQLENAEATRAKAEEERKARELEDQQQYKILAETEKAKREELEARIAADEKAAELKSEADKVFADYSPEVRKLAETTGLSLSDTDETSVAAFKAKLDEVKSMVGTPKVAPNNPNTPTPEGPSMYDADGVIKAPLDQTPEKFDELISQMPGIASMLGPTE